MDRHTRNAHSPHHYHHHLESTTVQNLTTAVCWVLRTFCVHLFRSSGIAMSMAERALGAAMRRQAPSAPSIPPTRTLDGANGTAAAALGACGGRGQERRRSTRRTTRNGDRSDLLRRGGRASCPRSLVCSFSVAAVAGPTRRPEVVDASCLAFLVRRAVQDKEEEEEERGRRCRGSKAQIIEEALRAQKRTQELLRRKRKKRRKRRLPRSSRPLLVSGCCLRSTRASSPSSAHCLVLQWMQVPASVPEAFWDFHVKVARSAPRYLALTCLVSLDPEEHRESWNFWDADSRISTNLCT